MRALSLLPSHTTENTDRLGSRSRARLKCYGPNTHSVASATIKRGIDIVASSFLLLLLAPTVFPIIALAVVIDSPGGVFYLQRRTGRHLSTFRCFKFRTMRTRKPGVFQSDAQRVTRLGLFFRKTHLDELPQLLNVWLGHMSLVGPRPHMLKDTHCFELMVRNYHLRHRVRPGITGLAQVNGLHGSVESIDHLRRRIQLDVEYVYTWTPWKDMKILTRTLFIPFKALR